MQTRFSKFCKFVGPLSRAPRDPVTLARTFGWADGLKTAIKFYVCSGAEMQDDTRKPMMAALDGLA